jgi:hypothetical protein
MAACHLLQPAYRVMVATTAPTVPARPGPLLQPLEPGRGATRRRQSEATAQVTHRYRTRRLAHSIAADQRGFQILDACSFGHADLGVIGRFVAAEIMV